jgi:nicotinamidase/pyrazinamidase
MSGYDSESALIVVDVQNDFADPAGSLYVKGGEEVVSFVNAQVDAMIAAGGRVFFTRDWHPPTTPHFKKDGGIWPDHCVAGTWGAEFHPDLEVRGPVVPKGISGEDGYSGFSMRHHETGETIPTDLEGALRAAGIRRVVVVGLATDYCVKATALDAHTLGFRTVVLAEGIRAVDLAPGDGERALAELREAGVEVVDDENVASESAARGSEH